MDLGQGSDTVIGGPGHERVETCSGSEPDAVSTADGDDWVGVCAKSIPDSVNLADGDDTLLIRGLHGPHGTFAAGAGSNTLVFLDSLRLTDKWVMDLAERRSTVNDLHVFSWDNATKFVFDGSPGALTINGSEARDKIELFSEFYEGPAWTVTLDLKAGDDSIWVDVAALGPRSRIDAGEGQDSLSVHASGRLDVSLHDGTLVRGRNGSPKRLVDVEDVDAHARHVRLTGDHRDNVLFATGCGVVVGARGGADRVTLGGYQQPGSHCSGAPHRAYGGSGDDHLHGGRHPDTPRRRAGARLG
jgi:hypothetical protein